jgi:hypothetical protein
MHRNLRPLPFVLCALIGASYLLAQTTTRTGRILEGAASPPAACSVGDVYYQTATTINRFFCNATNTWTADITLGGTNVFTGANTFVNLNSCYHVNGSQSFATALTNVGTTGCLSIDSGTYTVATSATIPIGVQTVFVGGGVLSVSSGQKLTINGPLVAGNYQIFAGTGTVALGGYTSPTNVLWFPGADIGAEINACIAALPTIGGYSSGICSLVGYAGQTVTLSTTVTISSPYVTISGPGSGSLWITSAVNGDAFRINTSPFVGYEAGELSGFYLNGTGAGANSVGVHMGDIIAFTLRDLVIENFNGTNSAGLWMDNVTGFAERTALLKVHLNYNTVAWLQTNTANTVASESMSYIKALDVYMNVGQGQTGIYQKPGATYGVNMWNATLNLSANMTGTSKTFILQSKSNIAFQGSIYSEDDGTSGAGGGVWLQNDATSSFTYSGTIQHTPLPGYTMTNSVSGVYQQTAGAYQGANTNPSYTNGGFVQRYPDQPATSSANVNSSPMCFNSNFWNGSASAQDIWCAQIVLNSGTNPVTNFRWTHTGGTSSPSIFDLSNAISLVYLPQINVTGGIATPVTTKTTTYSVNSAFDYDVLCNSSTGFTVTIPNSGLNGGTKYRVTNINAGPCTVSAGGTTNIDAATTYVIPQQYRSVDFVWDGTQYWSETANALNTVVRNSSTSNVFRVTSDFTSSSSTSLQTITGLSWVLPVNYAASYSFDCHLAYSQATPIGDDFGIQAASLAPTNIFATGHAQISAGPPSTYDDGTLATLTTTTATNIVGFTPGSTSIYTADLHGVIENPSGVANTINIMVKQSTAGDVIVVKRGSWCRVY